MCLDYTIFILYYNFTYTGCFISSVSLNFVLLNGTPYILLSWNLVCLQFKGTIYLSIYAASYSIIQNVQHRCYNVDIENINNFVFLQIEYFYYSF